MVGVFVGGMREKDVGEGSSVKVGNSVAVAVTSTRVAVHVGSKTSGVIVAVGTAFGSILSGGRGLNRELGKRNT